LDPKDRYEKKPTDDPPRVSAHKSILALNFERNHNGMRIGITLLLTSQSQKSSQEPGGIPKIAG